MSNDAGNYTVSSLPVGAYVVTGGALALQDRFHQAHSDGSQADRPARLQAGARGRRGDRRNYEPVAGAPDRVGDGGTGHFGHDTQFDAAEWPEHRPALAAPPWGRLTEPGSFTTIRNFAGGRPYVNGNREQTNNYTIDGVDMNESIDNLVAYQPSPDALEQISIETNNYSADTGNVAGAVISNVIKSGSNLFRGNAFEFYRNSSMDANSWSNNRSGAAKPERGRTSSAARWVGRCSETSCSFSATTRARGSTRRGSRPCQWRRRAGARATCRF